MSGTTSIFLAGDVMLGRGIDQILPHPVDSKIFERYVKTATDYVRLAEDRHGPISRPVALDYVWGDLLDELDRRKPDLRLINLETAVTHSNAAEPKGINYRMSPEHVGVLKSAHMLNCGLANNHVLDWGPQGLVETLQTLQASGINAVGAGRNKREASAPLIVETANRRMIVAAFGSPTSGIPRNWQALDDAPGVNLLPDHPDETVNRCRALFRPIRKPGDSVVVSVHWGGNWGYDIPPEQRILAHRLIDEADVDIVYGHSSHHPKPIEVYRDRLILYGCGDLINDYEGISGYESFRDDLTLAYFVRVSNADGRLEGLDMVPFRIRSMRLERAGAQEAKWLADTLNRESGSTGTRVEPCRDASMRLEWT